MIINMRKKKYGFTLIELLAVIVVLAIIFSITIIFSGVLMGDVTSKIDDATKKIIKNAANEYVIEFRNSNSDWKENIDESGEINFCVSLQSLIDKGYYDDKDEYVRENKDKILVSVKMNTSKVLDFNIIENNDDNINNYCIYNKSSSDLDNRVGDITIRDDNDEEDIGKLSYKVDKLDGKNYDVDINFSTTLSIETVERTVPVYVVVVLDNSGSMSGTAWNNARTAAISLSNTIINNLDEANIALVQFNEEPILSRKFENKVLENSNFIYPSGNTNVSGGLDLSASLYKELEDIPDNSMLYTILLYDGEPKQVSYLLSSNGSKLYNSSSSKYYDNFLSAYNKQNSNYSLGYSNNTSISYIQNAANYLKNTINSKLITIGYDFSGSNSLKEISSMDNEFCANSNYSVSSYKYNEITMNDIDMKSSDLTYPFKYNESDGSLVSTNVGQGTESYGVYELNLSNYSSNDEFEVEFDFTINYPNGNRNGTTWNYLKIVIDEKEERGISKFYNYACYSSGSWSSLDYCNTSSSTTKVNINGGKKYYIHLYYEQNSGTNGSVKINKINYSLTTLNTIYDNKDGYSDKFYLSTEEESKIVYDSKILDNKLYLSAKKSYTTSGGYKELDLTNKEGNYLLTINAESKIGRGTIYISKNSYPPQMPAISFSSSYYYDYIQSGDYNLNTIKRMYESTSATDFDFLIEGGSKYYIHFINDINSSSNSDDNFIINSMSLVKIGDKVTDDSLLTNISSDECTDSVNNISCLKSLSTDSYKFKYSNGSIISTNKEIANSCSHSYIEVDLTEYSINDYYAMSFDSLVSSEGRYDFGNISITDSQNSPTGRYCTLGSGRKCITIVSGATSSSSYARLQGGKKYYVHFNYCKDGSSDSNGDYFAVNKISVYKGINNVNYDFNDTISYKNYTFEEDDDRSLTSNNVGFLNTKAHRYIKIDLSEYSSSDRFLLEVDNYISSNNYGYLYLTSNTFYPANSYYWLWNSSFWGTSTQTKEKIITGGSVYYLHFVYAKSSNTSSSYEDIYRIDGVRVKKYNNDDSNYIDFSKDLYKLKNYYFTKENDKYVSNVNDLHSAAYSYFELDLSKYSSTQTINLIMNATLSESVSDNYIYFNTNNSIPIFSYYCSSSYCCRIYKGTADYTLSLTGGKKYYIHLLNSSYDKSISMSINSIKLEEKLLDKTDYYCYYNASVDSINTVFSNLSNKVSESVPKLAANKAEIVLTTNVNEGDKAAFHIEDKDGKPVYEIVKDIDLTNEDIDLENYTIELNDEYRFVLENSVKCPDDKKKCSLELKLFNIKLVLYYNDGEVKEVSLGEDKIPTVTINIESGEAVN